MSQRAVYSANNKGVSFWFLLREDLYNSSLHITNQTLPVVFVISGLIWQQTRKPSVAAAA